MKTHINEDAHTYTYYKRAHTFRNLHRQTRTHTYTHGHIYDFIDIKHIYTNSRERRYTCIKQTIIKANTQTHTAEAQTCMNKQALKYPCVPTAQRLSDSERGRERASLNISLQYDTSYFFFTPMYVVH